MAYSATVVANNVLSRAFLEGTYISPMKLQKVLYFVASEFQKKTGRRLFNEFFETWNYGPVLRSVYEEFRPYNKRSIGEYSKDSKGQSLIVNETTDILLKGVLDEVWAKTRDMGAVALSDITHTENSAWDKAFQAESPVLSFDDIAADNTYRMRLGLE